MTLVIPVAVLLFFGGTSLGGIGGGTQRGSSPGTIALAIIAAGLVNLGIATAYERQYGVLKRLGGAPLPRWGFVAAKLAAVLVLERHPARAHRRGGDARLRLVARPGLVAGAPRDRAWRSAR